MDCKSFTFTIILLLFTLLLLWVHFYMRLVHSVRTCICSNILPKCYMWSIQFECALVYVYMCIEPASYRNAYLSQLFTEIFLGSVWRGRGKINWKARSRPHNCMRTRVCSSILQNLLWKLVNMDMGCYCAYMYMYVQHTHFKVGGGEDSHERGEDSSPWPCVEKPWFKNKSLPQSSSMSCSSICAVPGSC